MEEMRNDLWVSSKTVISLLIKGGGIYMEEMRNESWKNKINGTKHGL
jgi:hypothetical protein